jgi:hypothetical protein
MGSRPTTTITTRINCGVNQVAEVVVTALPVGSNPPSEVLVRQVSDNPTRALGNCGRLACGVQRGRPSAFDDEPQHERQLSELGGEDDVRNHIFVLRQQ